MTVEVEDLRQTASSHTPLMDALREAPYLPFRRGFGLPLDAAVAGTVTAVDGAVGRGPQEGRVLLVREAGRVVAGVVLGRVAFDSSVYGIQMARSGFSFLALRDPGGERAGAEGLLDAAVAVCREWGVEHCSFLVSADDVALVHAAVARRWVLTDSTLTFTWDLRERATLEGACAPEVGLRLADAGDREVLRDMACDVYTRSIRTRFATDPGLALEATGRLYGGWAERACDGKFADAVAVAELDGQIVGFNMLKRDPALSQALGVEVAANGIAAVVTSRRGLGIMSGMEAYLNRWFRDRGGTFVNGRVLINNIPMQHALQKVGGKVTSAYHTFHAWLDGLPDRPVGGAG